MSKRDIVEELHKPARKNFRKRRVIIKGLDDLWQADLVEMGAYSADNENNRYLLTVIDTFSKFAWTAPIKNKTAVSVTKAMENILKKGRIPSNLQTDDGKEFFNTTFQSPMKKHNINHYSTFTSLKASIVERFNRTLKTLMWKEFSVNGSYCWINIIDTLTKTYNNSKHRTIKMKPSKVNTTNEKQILTKIYDNIKIHFAPKFKVGEFVRISKYKHVFDKGYTPNWTTEIFKITKIQHTNPVTYLLEDYQKTPIKGGFYELELQKTKFPDTYLIEKVLQRKKDQLLVKWLGFTPEHNSWIPIPKENE